MQFGTIYAIEKIEQEMNVWKISQYLFSELNPVLFIAHKKWIGL